MINVTWQHFDQSAKQLIVGSCNNNLWKAKLLISLKVCCVPSNVGGSKKSRLCAGIGGSKNNWLWCVATKCQASNVTAIVQSHHLLHKCMLPVFFATGQWSIASPCSAEIQRTSQQAAVATCPYCGLVLDTWAPPVVCPRRDSKTMQIIGSTKQVINS